MSGQAAVECCVLFRQKPGDPSGTRPMIPCSWEISSMGGTADAAKMSQAGGIEEALRASGTSSTTGSGNAGRLDVILGRAHLAADA